MITGLLYGGAFAVTHAAQGTQVSQAIVAPSIGATVGFSEDFAAPLAEEIGAAPAEGTQGHMLAAIGETKTASDGIESSAPRYSTAGATITS